MCLYFNVLDTRSVYRVYEHKAKIYAFGYPIGYQNRRRIFAFSSPVFRRKKIGRRFAAAAQGERRNKWSIKSAAPKKSGRRRMPAPSPQTEVPNGEHPRAAFAVQGSLEAAEPEPRRPENSQCNALLGPDGNHVADEEVAVLGRKFDHQRHPLEYGRRTRELAD